MINKKIPPKKIKHPVTFFEKKIDFFLCDKDWKTLLWGFQNGAKHPCSSTWADLVCISRLAVQGLCWTKMGPSGAPRTILHRMEWSLNFFYKSKWRTTPDPGIQNRFSVPPTEPCVNEEFCVVPWMYRRFDSQAPENRFSSFVWFFLVFNPKAVQDLSRHPGMISVSVRSCTTLTHSIFVFITKNSMTIPSGVNWYRVPRMDLGHSVPVYTRRDGHRIFFYKTNIPHSGTWVNKL